MLRCGSAGVSLALVCVVAAGAACTGPARTTDPGRPDRVSLPPAADGLTWQRMAAAPSARTEVTAAAIGSRIYLMGGFVASGATVPTVEILDTATGRWERGPDLPVAVNHAMAASVDGTVHLFGGYLAGGDASAAAFRLRDGGWQVLAPLPHARAAGTAVALGETVYLAAGVGPDGLAEQMLVYDAAADRWSTRPGPPTPREHLGGAGWSGHVYTVGGRAGGVGRTLGAFEVYDPGAGRWSRLPDLPTARGGLAAAASCTGHVVAVGGEAEATFAEAEAYDVRAGRWSALPPLPTARHGLGVVTVGPTLYTLAGGPRPGLHVADTAEAIDLGRLGRCPTPQPG